MSENVLKEWMGKLSYCEQSTVQMAFRKPDFVNLKLVNEAIDWIRGIAQKDGKDSDYMKFKIPTFNGIALAEELKLTSLDFAIHLLHALEVIGYRHPKQDVSYYALEFYEAIIHHLHFKAETKEEMTLRLKGKN